MDRGAWQATVHGIAKSLTRLSNFHFISLYFIDLLSIPLKCNDFTGIQKAVVDQASSRPPKSDRDLFWVQVWLWEVLWNFSLVQFHLCNLLQTLNDH